MADTNIIDIIIKATNRTKQALREPIRDLEDLQGALRGASTLWAAAGSAALAAGVVLAKQALDAGDKALEMSQKLGISAEAYTTLEFAARQSNLSQEAFEKGLQKLAVTAGSAAVGNQQAAQAFQQMGVSVTDAHGRMLPMQEILYQVSNRFATMPDNAAKAKLAVDLFGKSGVEMVPMLNEGAAGLQAMQQRARELGLEISGRTAAASDHFKDTLAQLGDGAQGVGRRFMADVLPGLNAILDGFVKGQGLGTAWNFILGTLGTAVSGVIKLVMSLVVEVDSIIETLGARIAQLAATVAAAAEGGISSAAAAWKAGTAEIERISQDAAQRQNAIWSGAAAGPPPPDPKANREGFEAVLKQNEEAKIALDTQRYEQLEAIKNFNLEQVNAQLAALEQKRFLNKEEAEDFKRLYQQKDEIQKKARQFEEEMGRRRFATAQDLASRLAALSSSSNQTLVAVSKAGNIAQATMSTYVAANEALKTFAWNPPLAFAMAGAFVAAGLANVAMIAGVPGFASGGVVPGNDFSGDRRLIRVNSAEEILTTEDRRQTTAALLGALDALRAGGQGGGGRTQLIVDKRVLGEVIYQGTEEGSIFIHPRALRAV